MNQYSPRKPGEGGSLIERAADAYGLGRFEHRPAPIALPAVPPVAAPAFTPPPAFTAPHVAAAMVAPAPAPALARPVAPAPIHAAVAIDRAVLSASGMIMPGASASVLAEEFRLVKRQLLQTARSLRADPAKARTILICSARPDEGKTFCAINLAISLAAERDTEVLLIDGDFAKRDLMPRLGLANGPGFLDALVDHALDAERLVVRTDIPQLSLLAAGSRTNDDTELLASERTREVLARLLAADPRRIVIFDSPPALAASLASVFALHAGQVMMVVRADRTTDGEIRDAVALLDGCEHIQLVLNQVRHQAAGYRFGDYYSPAEDSR